LLYNQPKGATVGSVNIPKFVVKVMVIGSDDVITSPSYRSREDADQALSEIAKVQGTPEVPELDWLVIQGTQVRAAYIEDRSIAAAA
jgi:primosomal protein N'